MKKLDMRADESKWRPLAGCEGYRVNGAGEIIHVDRGRYTCVRPVIDSAGRCSLRLKSSDKIRYISWGRAVYQSFCGAIPAGFVVIHKNHDKRDNSIRNLQAVPSAQSGALNGKKARRRAVMVRDNSTGEVLDVFSSATEASAAYSFTRSSVSKRCNGIRANTGKYSFEWELSQAEWRLEKLARKVRRKAQKKKMR